MKLDNNKLRPGQIVYYPPDLGFLENEPDGEQVFNLNDDKALDTAAVIFIGSDGDMYYVELLEAWIISDGERKGLLCPSKVTDKVVLYSTQAEAVMDSVKADRRYVASVEAGCKLAEDWARKRKQDK